MPYNFKEVEQEYSKIFAKIFKAKIKSKKPKFYCLEMFPYPTGRLHMGHVRNYTIGDAVARMKRMQGYNVLYPMGYDSFGLPAENAAIKHKIKPNEWTEKCIKDMKEQQIAMGNSYEWDREIATHKPEYYKWNQFFFIKFFEKGLIYKKLAPVNWCPKCNTVLANEQVHNGRCWRHEDTKVEIKLLNQWFLKITDYADELLKDLEKLDWPERIKEMQRNWIGKNEGTLVKFKLEKNVNNINEIEVFTTRVDTIFGVSFIAIAPEHPLTLEFVKGKGEKEKEVKEFISKVLIQERFERSSKEKEGIFLDNYAIHPFTNEKIPIFTANFVLPDYGTGIVMGVPAHDVRDYEFAKKYKLPIKVVIKADKTNNSEVYEGYGILINSGEFNGLTSQQAIEEITKKLKEKGLGDKSIQFKIRDWLISRQRYWGTPIPIIYCENCGIVTEKIENLPVLLPDPNKVKFGEGNPLETVKTWLETKCPKCNKKARRDSDTLDTFFDSSWYFLRFIDPKNDKEPFNKNKIKLFMPVDFYIGGAEHATMHLIYARFFTKVLRDLNFLDFDEPFLKLVNQGIVTLGGEAMSKSKGNIVDPFEIIPKYGADALRFFILFKAMPDKDLEWSDEGIENIKKFLDKIIDIFEYWKENKEKLIEKSKNKLIITRLNLLIKEYTQHLNNLEFPYALIKLMDFVKLLNKNKEKISNNIFRLVFKNLALIMNPITPYLSEYLWKELGFRGYASLAKWPNFNENKIKAQYVIEEDYIKNLISDINEIKKIIKIEKIKKINIIIADRWKYEIFKLIKECKNINEAIEKIKNSEYSDKLDYIVKFLPKFIGKIDILIDQKEEINIIKGNLDELKKIFKAKINLLKENRTKDEKAKKAMPLKPSIILE
ncbi:MAG: leucine--tRNA ligase [Candidatus Pacearchaeota archaeon]